jgi:thioredoxin reductase (NADPH)
MVPASSILERRRDQMFPELDPFEIERMRRFGEARGFAQGEAIFTAGRVGPGLVVILSGEVDIIRREFSNESLIVTDGPGQFMGELAQLAGRPALAGAVAKKPVQALIIAPERLRALLIAEAELGERIMRALILRRVGLLETGAGGPTIVRPRRQRRCAPASGLSPSQRSSASIAQFRDR